MKYIKTLTSAANGMGGYFGLMALYWQAVGLLTEDVETYIDYRYPGLAYADPANPSKNVWELYFEQPYGKTIEQVDDELRNNIFGEHIRDDFNNYHFVHFLDGYKIFGHPRIEKIRFWAQTIGFSDSIKDKVRKFFLENMVSKRVLGVQKRGTDHYTIGHGRGGVIRLNDVLEEVDWFSQPYDKILLVTDEAKTLRAFRERYGEKLIHYDDATLSEDDEPIHKKFRGIKIGEDVCVEASLLSSCDYLLAMASNICLYSIMVGGMPFHKIDMHIKYR